MEKVKSFDDSSVVTVDSKGLTISYPVTQAGPKFLIAKGKDAGALLLCKACCHLSRNPSDAKHRFCPKCRQFLDADYPMGRIPMIGSSLSSGPELMASNIYAPRIQFSERVLEAMAARKEVSPAHLCEQAFAQLTPQQQHEENADDVPPARGLDQGKLLQAFAQLTPQQQHEENADDVPPARGLDQGKLLHHLSGSTPRLSWPAEDLAILAAIASVLEIDHFPEDAEAHLLPDNRGGTWAIVRGNLPPAGVIIRYRDGHVLLDSAQWTPGAVSWRMEFHLDAGQTKYALNELSRIEESLPSAPTVQELIEIQGADAARVHDRRFEVQPGPGPFAAGVQRSLRGPIDA